MNNPLILNTSAAALLFGMSAMALGQSTIEGPIIDKASITGFGEPATIRVISNNKESWTNVAKSDLELRVQVRIDMLEGRIRRYIIGPSRWGGENNSELLNVRVRGSSEVRENHIINASLASLDLNQDDFVTRCNNLLSLRRDTTKRHVLSERFPVRLRAVMRARTSEGDSITRTYSTWGSIPLNIVCAPVRRPTPKITAYSLTVPQNISGACPQDIPMRTRIVANRRSEFRYRLVREDGSTTQFYTANTERREGKHVAVGKHVIKIRRSLNTRYRMEIEGVKQPSEWARLNVSCKRIPPKFVIEDALTVIRDKDGNTCPRDYTVVSRIRTNRPGPVTFRLARNDGWTSPFVTVKSVRQSNGRFVAVHRRPVKARKSHNFNYRVLVKGSSVASQWKAANIKCRKAAAPKPKRLLVKSIDMDIVSARGPLCPKESVLTSSIEANKAGPVRFRIVRENGVASPVRTAQARPAGNGRFVAKFNQKFLARSPGKTRYRMEMRRAENCQFVANT